MLYTRLVCCRSRGSYGMAGKASGIRSGLVIHAVDTIVEALWLGDTEVADTSADLSSADCTGIVVEYGYNGYICGNWG